MACVARHPIRMICRDDLRETFGLCCARGMTANTKGRGVRQLRPSGRRVIGTGVLCLRSMTGFAVYVSVLTRLLRICNVNVTCLTCVVTGELHRARGDLTHSCPTIVSVLAEARRHDKVADHQKLQKSKNKEPGEPEQMACIL